ncbi:FKBP-type peptidyl-prolyl cis-trans isomerase [Maricurvus nonylphenolicus]|uniref:FKBP-type peptidyl-prolyl cis-trans isomerase n=1 Tax=Maricurvus nonylphenolicus TaxID=1008307 RepID=UPI0036F3D100
MGNILVIVIFIVMVVLFSWRHIDGKKAAEANREAGKAFLAENGQKEGVVTTASGLQYLQLNPGQGDKPGATDRVKVHYHGTTLDGKVFDSSIERGEPISFSLNQVILGWTEGVQMMQVGEKARLFIPADLAYGDRGAGTIPPGATLIFDVELLAING